MPHDYTVAAYYFPNWHVDPRNEAAHGPGWTEWEVTQCARPRFPGHRQPRVPVWGYEDEADPQAMARKIAAAADHGIDAFIYCWYWSDEGSFRERAIREGFLGAPNHDRLKFAFMWANHDRIDVHPAKLSMVGKGVKVLHPARFKHETFVAMTDHIIREYFPLPGYWRIEGRPYFSFFNMAGLFESYGSVERLSEVLADLRDRVAAAGFPGLHLNADLHTLRQFPGVNSPEDEAALLDQLGFDSAGTYGWSYYTQKMGFPLTPYADLARQAVAAWNQYARVLRQRFDPTVAMGWDSSPRTVQSDRYINAGYPFSPVWEGNTPAAFESSLREARDFLASRPGRPAHRQAQRLERMDRGRLSGAGHRARHGLSGGDQGGFSAG